jgi:hypothetical protein
MASHLQWVAPLVALLVNANCWQNELVHDDFFAITNNPDVTSSDVSLKEIFSHDFWGRAISDRASHKSYRPLVVLTFRLNHMLHGLQPCGYVVVNVLLHACASALLYHIALRLLEGTHRPCYGALAAATIFAVHPVHAEAVAGIVGRAETACCCFMFLAFLSGMRAASPGIGQAAWPWAAAVVVLMVCATLCKETGITVMGLLLLYEVLYVGLSLPTCSRQLVYAIASASFLAWRLSLNEGAGPDFRKEMGRGDGITWWRSTCFVWSYNALLLGWPWHLSADYSTMDVRIETWTDPRNAASLALLAGGLLLLLLLWRRREVLLAVAWVAVPFLPASGLFFTVGFAIAE